MKYALVEGERREAMTDLSGKCPDCAGAVVAKCGEVRDWHWAHWRMSDCDRCQNMVWVVHGLGRKRTQFFASLRAAVRVNSQLPILAVHSSECALLRDWEASRVPVYFDFGDSEPGDTLRFNTPTLWRLTPCGMAYLLPVSKAEFLRVHLEGLSFEEECTEAVKGALSLRAAPQSRGLIGFERYWAKKQKARTGRRF